MQAIMYTSGSDIVRPDHGIRKETSTRSSWYLRVAGGSTIATFFYPPVYY